MTTFHRLKNSLWTKDILNLEKMLMTVTERQAEWVKCPIYDENIKKPTRELSINHRSVHLERIHTFNDLSSHCWQKEESSCSVSRQLNTFVVNFTQLADGLANT